MFLTFLNNFELNASHHDLDMLNGDLTVKKCIFLLNLNFAEGKISSSLKSVTENSEDHEKIRMPSNE